jgi:hypothetical protein
MTDSEFKTQVVRALENINHHMMWLLSLAGSALLFWLLGLDK